MRVPRSAFPACLLLSSLVVAGSGMAQSADSNPPAAAAPQPVPLAPKTFTVPAGTKVLLQLKNSVNTRSAKPGDGVYLTSLFPVVVNNRVMIPV